MLTRLLLGLALVTAIAFAAIAQTPAPTCEDRLGMLSQYAGTLRQQRDSLEVQLAEARAQLQKAAAAKEPGKP